MSHDRPGHRAPDAPVFAELDERVAALEGGGGASGSLSWARITSSPQDAVNSGAPAYRSVLEVEWTAIASSEFAGLEVDGTDVTLGSGVFLVSWSAHLPGEFESATGIVTGESLRPVSYASPSPLGGPTEVAGATSVVQGPATISMTATSYNEGLVGATVALTIVKIA